MLSGPFLVVALTKCQGADLQLKKYVVVIFVFNTSKHQNNISAPEPAAT